MDHDHGSMHTKVDYSRAFAFGVALNVTYIIVEVGYGFAINSLALLADAIHNLSDVIGILLAWGANYLVKLKPTKYRTYGWKSSSVFAALLNALLLLVVIGGISWEAIERLFNPTTTAGFTVIVVAAVGVVINTATALLFLRGRHKDLNIKGAFLHMAADAGVSVAVVLGGLGIAILGWQWLDPIMSLLIAAVIFWATWGLLRDSTNLALHAVPTGIEPAKVNEYLLSRDGVSEVHDLHIWAMSTTETALTAHLVIPNLTDEDTDHFLHETNHVLHDRFNIQHSTLQLERSSDHCHLAAEDVV